MNWKNRRALGGALFLLCTAAPGLTQPLGLTTLDVRGNTKMTDQEIVDLCNLGQTSVLTHEKLEQAIECFADSGRFRSAEFAAEGRTLVLNVIEKPNYTGLVDASVSADDDRGIGLGLYIEKDELFSEQYLAKVDLDYTKVEQSADFQFINKRLFGPDRPGGVRLNYLAHDYDSDPYSAKTGLFEGFALHPFSEHTVARFSLGGRHQDIETTDTNAGPYVQQDEGIYRDIVVGAELNHQTEFRIANKAGSVFLGASQFLYQGDGGTLSRTKIDMSMSTQLSQKFSFNLNASAGALNGSGGRRSVISDRFTLGGQSLRGFAPRGIGPRENGFAIGGDKFVKLGVSGDVLLGQLGGVGFRSGVFAEAGSVWNLSDAPEHIDDDFLLRSSTGLSVTVEAGGVPVDLYYAVPVKQGDQDQAQRFGFSIRSNF